MGKKKKKQEKKKSVGGKRFLPCSDCIYFLIEIVKIQSKIYFLQVRELLLTAFPEFLSLKKKGGEKKMLSYLKQTEKCVAGITQCCNRHSTYSFLFSPFSPETGEEKILIR